MKDEKLIQAAMPKCIICNISSGEKELAAAVEYNISTWSKGIIFTTTLKNNKLLKKYRAIGEKEQKLCEKLLKMGSEDRAKKVCPICDQYLMFRKNGAIEERILTPNGTITLMSAKDPALLKELHAWGKQLQKFISSADPEACDKGTEVKAIKVEEKAGSC